jgi:hypothetical protein
MPRYLLLRPDRICAQSFARKGAMPIDYKVFFDRKLVYARCHGTLTDGDVSSYQGEVWSNTDVQGFDEIVDLSGVELIELPSFARMKQFAAMAAKMDAPSTSSKLAIAAVTDIQFGLGQMYAGWRNSDQHATKQVQVFRSLPDAMSWLGVKDLSVG